MIRPAAGQWLNGQAYTMLSLTMLFWAGNGVLARFVAGHVPPVALAWMRWSVALAMLLPLAWPQLKRDLPAMRRSLPILLLLSLTGITSYNTMAYVGFQYTTAINGLLLQSTAPLLIGVWSFVLFCDRLTALQLAGTLMSMAGVVTIVSGADWQVLAGLSVNVGDLWILAALVAYALYAALLRLRPEIHWMSLVCATFFLGNILLTPVLLWEISTGYVLQFDALTAASIGYTALFASLLAYIFFNRGVELIGPNRAGPFFHLIALFGVVLAVAFLGERLQLFHVAGFAAILLGIVMAARSQHRLGQDSSDSG
jgi:drug/metabolite transporter (DMT)-like permease